MDELLNSNQQIANEETSDNQFILSEWKKLISITSPDAFNLLHTLSKQKSSTLAGEFYSYMLKDPEASLFLSSQQVHDRLFASMRKWIEVILSNSGENLDELIAHQKKIGQIHARIGIPIELVARGSRRLKWKLYEYMSQQASDKSVGFEAMRFASISMDIATEIMSKSYSHSHDSAAKSEESYRLLSLLNNADIERERQNAALLNWENTFIFNVATGAPLITTHTLEDSEFGLWFNHKGKPSFGNTQDAQAISEMIKAVDEDIGHFNNNIPLKQNAYAPLLKSVRNRIHKIHVFMDSLFDEIQKLENGKDTLTLLLNRRFLPTILRHETSLAMRKNTPLTIAMIDIDHFKVINDTYGHAVGDAVLKNTAEIFYENTRSSDYIFRYGGEEFMFVLIETTKDTAYTFIERLREKIQNHKIRLQSNETINITISAGIAMYSGHPDYQYLINAADAALYQAKANGRNRIEFAPE
ncbi:diguanylate cyclase [Brenneria izadpanahii]|uniref:Diguanylate cyclase DosC n=1 Tax=Brenneria izadpanahii TaxID=2722756 RepID=A0ABX7UQE7_9GAMM|nr:diguanylate cyclase [Brenneria izadpanahii]QTF07948.1 diguanylate cyclase [Brenneria izadpanahii]